MSYFNLFVWIRKQKWVQHKLTGRHLSILHAGSITGWLPSDYWFNDFVKFLWPFKFFWKLFSKKVLTFFVHFCFFWKQLVQLINWRFSLYRFANFHIILWSVLTLEFFQRETSLSKIHDRQKIITVVRTIVTNISVL